MTTTDQSNNNQLTREFKDFIGGLSHGMALVGVASIDRFDNFPTGHGPRDFIADANAVIVIALPIVEGVMGLEHFMEKSEIFKEQDTYTNNEGNTKVWSPRVVVRGHIESRNSHEILNIELQTLSMYSALFLEKNGYRTVYMPTTYGNTMSWPGNLDRSLPRAAPQWYGPFSHRHAAVAAGLGEFGLNNLFLTPEYGPRVRLVSIITAAPLTADPVLENPICLGKKCSLCVKACPAKAFGDIYEIEIAGKKNYQARISQDDCAKFNKVCYKKCVRACPVALKFGKA
ncbi:hypothetical protein [Sporomusa sp.]|uniref:hypothetical protein n=1 Tax=Sporomusa sp. TaxID=2078658 RepID=UPI002CE3021F|nr:hypothetical protein [Sporomusa sp.]HWR06272.1 hypothetical protein [Sporomusa sp.]